MHISTEQLQSHNVDQDNIHSEPNTETIGSSSTPYIPEVGQQFNSHDEAGDAYMGYAGNIGFNVHMGSTKMNDHEMVGRRFLCSKQGYALSTDTANNVNERKHRRIRNSRSGCLAMIYISLDRSTRLWRVVNFIEDHNHPMVTPSKRRYLPVNRVITPLSRALFKSLNTSNISPSDQYCVAAQEAGGFDHMQYTPSDLSNMRCDDRCNIIQRDADLLNYFKKKDKIIGLLLLVY
ncbi:hypothetical protein ZOSMA_215G00430 [Zostera marina]|uniref:FAR1 domain-containing protein n=1 Tax=Zostera marina TaxID=29655 RepID=A0A0K9PK21_ZOSMR|nr:hypothetical protein ZOSMA_215G00430 [Zostera marina]